MTAPIQYEFGPFRLDVGARLLFRDGKRLPLTPKSIELLVVLVEAGGNPVGKEELLQKVWADAVVEEGSLASHVSILRKALTDKYIETLPKRGYRFAGTAKPATEPQIRAAPIQSLAVLPLENLTRDSEGANFADSMTEALITNLAKIGALRVVSRTSAMRYKNAPKPLPEIARELNVEAVVEGSVQRDGNRVRISARLVSAATDQHLWAEAYDRDLRDILILQDEVARTIARQIQGTLTPDEQARLSTGRKVDPEAYQLTIKGRYLWEKRTEESILRAIACFQRAIEIDPNYAAAHSGLADCYSSLGFSFDVGSQPPADVQPKARAAARRALELDETLAEAHNSLAYVNLNYDWDWVRAETEFKRSLQLNPGYANAHHWYAHHLLSSGRSCEALAESKRALELDPLSPIMNLHLGWHHFYSRQYDDALDQLAKTLELESNFGLAYWYRGLAYEQKHMFPEALQNMEKARKLLNGLTTVEANIGHLYAVSGRKKEAEKTITTLKKQSAKRYVSPYEIALIFVGLGLTDQAFEWLDSAFRDHFDMLVYFNVDPRLDPIRADPRFGALGERVGVPA